MAMTLEQRGLYRELLDHCWEHGSIPNSDVVLRRILRVSEREWKRAWPTVREQFFEVDGRLHNSKVDERKPSLDAWHENRREAGRKGGLSKRASSASSSAKAQPVADLKPSASASASTTSAVEAIGDTHTQDSVRVNASQPPNLNGHTSQRFEEFWKQWPRQTGKDAAATAWCSYVSIESEGKVFACLARFLNSGDVERGAIPMAGPSSGKSGWLADCARDDWQCNWPPRNGNSEPRRMMVK